MTVISRAPKNAYIQASKYPDGFRDHPYLSDSCNAAAKALKSLGYEVKTFTPAKLPPRHKITPDTPVKGGTGCVKYLYEMAFGVTYPNFDVPPELARFARRKIEHSTLGELRARNNTRPFAYYEKFVKPSVQAKLFGAQSAQYAATWACEKHPDSTPIIVQDYRDFDEEVRFFVSPWTGPVTVDGYTEGMDRDTLRKHRRIEAYARDIYEAWKPTGPKCYVMDVGMSRNPHADTWRYYPTLVEINSVLTAGNLDEVKSKTNHPGRLVATGWKSYARYAEQGRF